MIWAVSCLVGTGSVSATATGSQSATNDSRVFRSQVSQELTADIEQQVRRLNQKLSLPVAGDAATRRLILKGDLDIKSQRQAFADLYDQHGAVLILSVEPMLRHQKPKVRRNALAALAALTRLDRPKGRPAEESKELIALLLIRALDDKIPAHRISTAGIIHGFGTSAAPELGQKLATAMSRQLCDAAEEGEVRVAAAHYLFKMGYSSLIPDDLRAGLEHGES